MKRWLFVLFLISVFYVLSWLNKKNMQQKFPILKRIDYTLTIAAWVILSVYGIVFLYWLIKTIFW